MNDPANKLFGSSDRYVINGPSRTTLANWTIDTIVEIQRLIKRNQLFSGPYTIGQQESKRPINRQHVHNVPT